MHRMSVSRKFFLRQFTDQCGTESVSEAALEVAFTPIALELCLPNAEVSQPTHTYGDHI